MKRIPITLLALALFAAPSMVRAQSSQGRVLGTVLDPEGKPLVGVSVLLQMRDSDLTIRQKTNKRGRFTLTVVDATRDYVIRLEMEGFVPVSEPVDPQIGTGISKTWVLQPSGGTAPTQPPPGVDLSGSITSKSSEAIRAYNAGRKALENGDVASAMASFEQATTVDPTLTQVLEILTQLQYQEGQIDAAIATSERILAIEPANAVALGVRYDGMVQQGRTEEALPYLDAVVAADRSQMSTARLYNAGVRLIRAGKADEAIQRLEQAVELSPDMAQPHSLLGSIYLDRKNYEKALHHADRLLAIEPQSSKALSLQLSSYKALGDNEKAEAALAALKASDPKKVAESFYAEGKSHFDAGRPQQAVSALQLAVDADPDHARSHFQLAMALVSTGDTAGAKEHFERFLELAPDDPEAGSAVEMLKYLN